MDRKQNCDNNGGLRGVVQTLAATTRTLFARSSRRNNPVSANPLELA